VPMRMWLWLSRTSTAERVGEGSSPRCSASPVSISEKVLDWSRRPAPPASRSRGSRARRPSASAARRRSGCRASGPSPWCRGRAAGRAVAQLREQEAAAVADVGIVGPELVAVIAQRQRLRQVVRQRLEAAEMAQPFLVAQPSSPTAAPSGRCGTAGSSAGSRPPRRDRRRRSPSERMAVSGR
jgi:hypothetical protein